LESKAGRLKVQSQSRLHPKTLFLKPKKLEARVAWKVGSIFYIKEWTLGQELWFKPVILAG
jgi:hypothetical protein